MEEIELFLSEFLKVESNISTYQGRKNLDIYNNSVNKMKELIVEELSTTLAINVHSFEKSGLALKMILKSQPNYLESQKERAANYPETPVRFFYKIERYINSIDENVYAVFLSPYYIKVDFSNLQKPSFVEPDKENSELLLISYIDNQLKAIAAYSYTNRGTESSKKYYATGGLNHYSIKNEFWEFDYTKLGNLAESKEYQVDIPDNIKNSSN